MDKLQRLGQWLCALWGHDYILDYPEFRLVCQNCGHLAPGVHISTVPRRKAK